MGLQITRMLRGAAVVTAALAVAQPSAAQVLDADTAGVHVVRRGDTLWDLARFYLQDPFLWPRIYELNTDQVDDPHWIYPAERLRIPGLTGGPGAALPGTSAARYRDLLPEQMPRTVFYPSASMEGRTLLGPDETPSPAVQPFEFFSASIISPERMAVIGRVEEIVSPTVVPVDPPRHALPYQRVFLSIAAPGAIRRGQQVQIVREHRRVRPYGYIYRPTGLAQVIDIENGTATLEVQEMYDALAMGDFAVPLPEYGVPLEDRPVPMEGGFEAQLIGFEVEQPVYALRDIGFVSAGRASGLVEGDEFEAYIPREQRRWGNRPEIPVARLRVIRVAEQTSTVQVVSMSYPAIETGLPVRLVAKMPG